MAIAHTRIEGSRDAILAMLRRQSNVGVDEFAAALGLAGATVRRHLDVLLRDGHVDVQQERGGAGRPRYVFSLSEAGAELFAQHHVRLTRRLIDEIVQLDATDTEGRDGRQIAELLFEKLAGRLAREYAPLVAGGALPERVRSAVALLADEGIDFAIVAEPGGAVRLLGRGCPCRRFDPLGHTGCDHDRRLLTDLLGTPVDALSPADLPGEVLCGYRVLPDAPVSQSAQ